MSHCFVFLVCCFIGFVFLCKGSGFRIENHVKNKKLPFSG
ncbi:Hypothetical protein Ccan_09770 [Capnocytophaga canimorsus Cc5]|uniref:Uncharacterized protein n=1 Tax=Capnocytophaga canimorsus (strain 5) TaxID=860228 RepID=F9YUX0_CAPCC|nr:Hypothetical protein Ccan_09770 [Capnocytophaga canimorsus Cc5]